MAAGLWGSCFTNLAISVPSERDSGAISGVYFDFGQLRGWLQDIASLFPLRWLALGLRSVFLPDTFAAAEPDGSWQTATIAIVMVIWCVVGLFITRRTFTWMSERER